jgi:hypothetical protein
MDPDDLRHQATRFRAIATRINDAQTIKALHDLAAEYEARANKIAAQREVESPDGRPDDRK